MEWLRRRTVWGFRRAPTFGSPASRTEAGEKGKLGVAVEALTPAMAKQLGLKDASNGVVVRRVEDGSPAANAGIQPGDVILEVDRQPVKDVAGLKGLVAKHAKGTPMVVLLHREAATLYVVV